MSVVTLPNLDVNQQYAVYKPNTKTQKSSSAYLRRFQSIRNITPITDELSICFCHGNKDNWAVALLNQENEETVIYIPRDKYSFGLLMLCIETGCFDKRRVFGDLLLIYTWILESVIRDYSRIVIDKIRILSSLYGSYSLLFYQTFLLFYYTFISEEYYCTVSGYPTQIGALYKLDAVYDVLNGNSTILELTTKNSANKKLVKDVMWQMYSIGITWKPMEINQYAYPENLKELDIALRCIYSGAIRTVFSYILFRTEQTFRRQHRIG